MFVFHINLGITLLSGGNILPESLFSINLHLGSNLQESEDESPSDKLGTLLGYSNCQKFGRAYK